MQAQSSNRTARQMAEAIVWHEWRFAEVSPDRERERAVCATCGWRGPWRKKAKGWGRHAPRDFREHREATHRADLDAMLDRATEEGGVGRC